MPDSSDGNGYMVFAIERITEGRNKTAFAAVVLYAGLGVVGYAPGGAVERYNHAGLCGLTHLAVVSGVGLSGYDEYLANTDVRDVDLCDGIA